MATYRFNELPADTEAKVYDAAGAEVQTGTTDTSGVLTVDLEPGSYTATAYDVQGQSRGAITVSGAVVPEEGDVPTYSETVQGFVPMQGGGGAGLSFAGCAIGISYSWADDLVLPVPQFIPLGESGYLLTPSTEATRWHDADTHPWRKPPTVTVQGALPPVPDSGADASDGMKGWMVVLTTEARQVSDGASIGTQTWLRAVESAMGPTPLTVSFAGTAPLYIDGDGFPTFDPTVPSILHTTLQLRPRYF